MPRLKRKTWRVGVDKPRKGSKYFSLVLFPPPNAIDEHGQPMKKERWGPQKGEFLTTLDDAKKRARRLETDLNLSLETQHDMTVAQVMDLSMLMRADWDESTKETNRAALKAVEGLLSHVRSSRLDRAKVLRARDALQKLPSPQTGRPRSASTINLYIRSLAAAFDWAHERGYVKQKWPRVRRLKTKRTKKRPYEPEEVALTLHALKHAPHNTLTNWYAFFALLADSGARVSEIGGLRGQDVDRVNGQICIRGKGQKDEDEWVSAPPETLAELPQVDADEWLWPRRGGGAPVHSNSALIALRKALEVVGLDYRELDVHSFRRAWIAAADEENVPLGVAMAQTLHRKPDVHMRYRERAKNRQGQGAVQAVRRRRVEAAGRLGLTTPVEMEAETDRESTNSGTYTASKRLLQTAAGRAEACLGSRSMARRPERRLDCSRHLGGETRVVPNGARSRQAIPRT